MISPEPTHTAIAPALYLLPVTMSQDQSPAQVLPQPNIEILRRIRHYVVENVRTARRFLKNVDRSIDINTLTFAELNNHTPETDIPAMLEPLRNGHAVGLMSEAGCPAVADPGARLVAEAQRAGLKVVPMVGPSSIIMSLMASGMNGQNFTFNGYLPIRDDERDRTLRRLAAEVARTETTQIFIETPYRNNRLLARMAEILPGNLRLCVASDITGPSESIVTRTLASWKKSGYNYDKIPTIFLLGQ